MLIQQLFYGFNIQGECKIVLINSPKTAFSQLQKLSEQPIIKIKKGSIYFSSPFKKTELIIFTTRLSTLIKAGLTLLHALKLLKKEEKKPYWIAVFDRLIYDLTQGDSFAKALSIYPQVFPTIYYEMIAMCELTGHFELGLNQLALQLTAQNELKKRIQKSLRYPLFLFCMTLLACFLILLFVLPQFSNLYANFDAKLPKITSIFIYLSNQLQQNFLHLILISLCILSLFWIIKHKYSAQWELTIFKLPFIGVILKTGFLASFFKTLALTQSHQIALSKALQISRKTLNSHQFQSAIFNIQQEIERGLSLSLALKKSNLFPDLCIQLIQIGEETGDLATQLHELAQYYKIQNEEKSEVFSKALEPFFMSLMALLIGTLIIAVYLPIFNLGNIF